MTNDKRKKVHAFQEKAAIALSKGKNEQAARFLTEGNRLIRR
jgi:hypothetical protein